MILKFKEYTPEIHNTCYISENATIIGRVTLKKNVSIWYGTVIRGDENCITVGENTNIQDNCTVHIGYSLPTIIGENITIGHGATIHGCTIKNNVLVGMGAIILDGAVINENVIIGAGSLVPPGKVIPSNSLVMGSPAKVVRQLTEKDIVSIKESALDYINTANDHKNCKDISDLYK